MEVEYARNAMLTDNLISLTARLEYNRIHSETAELRDLAVLAGRFGRKGCGDNAGSGHYARNSTSGR